MSPIRAEIAYSPAKDFQTVDWTTLVLMLAGYGVWLMIGLTYTAEPWLATLALSIPVAFHSSLQHEALHGHPTRSPYINEALIFIPLSPLYPFRRYKNLHLRHHVDERLTDPFDDPESYYSSSDGWDRAPSALRALLEWNNTLSGRLIVGPAIGSAGFVRSELVFARRSDGEFRKAWALHLLGLLPVAATVVFVFRMPVWAYLISTYLAISLISIRSFCEHQWSETPWRRTVIVESRLLAVLFLNNNLHLVHHTHPGAPWHRLPALHRAQREAWREMNGGYVFRTYAEVLRRYAFRIKEPVLHPAYLRTADAPQMRRAPAETPMSASVRQRPA